VKLNVGGGITPMITLVEFVEEGDLTLTKNKTNLL